MSTKTRIILHGKQSDNSEFRELLQSRRERGHDIDVRVTWEAGDARVFAREAAEAGISSVVAAGGDGSINEVLNGLDDAGLGGSSLGVLPLGTANDFARSAGIPLELDAALDLILEGQSHSIDVGRSEHGCFINVATGGFGTEVTVNTDPTLKRLLGGAAYFVTGLTRFFELEPIDAELTGPGIDWQGKLVVLAVGNGRQAGGGHNLCPDASVDDGLLDVAVLPDFPDGTLTEVIENLMLQGPQAIEEAFIRWRAPAVEVRSKHGLYINMDGEPRHAHHHRFELHPHKVRFHLPRDCPLLK